MSETGNQQQDAATEIPRQESVLKHEGALEEPETARSDDGASPPLEVFNPEHLASQRRRVDCLSSELSDLLADVHSQLKTAFERLEKMQSEIDQKNEELQAIEQKAAEKREAADRDLHRREQALSERERECERFIEELERMMARLSRGSGGSQETYLSRREMMVAPGQEPVDPTGRKDSPLESRVRTR